MKNAQFAVRNPQFAIHEWASRQSLDIRGWRANRHVQTVWNRFALRRERVPTEEILHIPLIDGTGQLQLLVHRRQVEAPLVLLFHGLEGSAEAPYMVAITRRALDRGWNAVRINTVNCGGTEHLARRFYHAGMTEMIESVLPWALSQGFRRVFLAGFSLGGNQVLRYLGLRSAEVPIEVQAAAVVSTPIDLEWSCRSIDARSNFVYRYNFLHSMHRTLAAKRRLHPELFSGIPRRRRARTFREFDDWYTAPLCQFRSADDYWTSASSIRLLGHVSRPTLILHAQDDPFIPIEQFEQVPWQDNPNLVPLFTSKGGHLGFHGEDSQWGVSRMLEFFEETF